MQRVYQHPAAFASLLLLAAASSSTPVQAAPPAGKNGGTVAVFEGHPVEFVSTGQTVTFYISDDDGSPLDTKAVTGRAILRTNDRTVIVPLTPEPPNRLTGTLAAPLNPGDKVLLDAKLHGHKLQPRFER